MSWARSAAAKARPRASSWRATTWPGTKTEIYILATRFCRALPNLSHQENRGIRRDSRGNPYRSVSVARVLIPSELQTFSVVQLFQYSAIYAGDFAQIIYPSERVLLAARHDLGRRLVTHLQGFLHILHRRGVHVDDREISLEIVHHPVQLIIGAVRAIAGHFGEHLFPAIAAARCRKKLRRGMADRAYRRDSL